MSHVMVHFVISKLNGQMLSNLGEYLILVPEKSVNFIPILYCIHTMFSMRITLFCVAAADKEWSSLSHFSGQYVLLRVQKDSLITL